MRAPGQGTRTPSQTVGAVAELFRKGSAIPAFDATRKLTAFAGWADSLAVLILI